MSLITWRPDSMDFIVLLVRVLFGIACIAHGWGKVTGIDGFMNKWGLSSPTAWAVAITQTLGGALVILGLAHGWANLALAICGAGITWKLIVDAKEPFTKPGQHSWDMGLMYTLLPLALLVTGPGRYAIDAALR
jgi:putative oxidoreductase